MKRLAIASLAASLLALSGCIHVHEHEQVYEPEPEHEHGGGPPPWAPAHGYRRHHHGAELVFDAEIGVYVVVGHPHVYFFDDHYFRRVSSHWERCRNFEKAHWKIVDVAYVPAPLMEHYAKHPKHHGKGKGNGPAKHDD